ncbi:MAG: GNAT family N-acetyltransferase [Candidatus Velthaea sp.]
MSVGVRAASVHDVEALAPLFDAYRVFYEMPSDLAAARAFLDARLRRDESRVFIAFDRTSNEAIGFTRLYPSFSSTMLGRLWILNDLFVDPQLRRVGAGSALLAAAEEFARSTDAIGIMLSTAHTNSTAQSLYVKCGYVHDTVFRDYYLYL